MQDCDPIPNCSRADDMSVGVHMKSVTYMTCGGAFACVYMCVRVSACARERVCVCLCVCVCVCICVSVRVCVHGWMDVYVHACEQMCLRE